MGESNLQTKVIKYIKKNGGYVINIHGGSMYQRSGIPDLIICFKGRFVGIELKYGKGKTTPLQKANINMINKAGGISFSSVDYNFIVDQLESI